MNKVMLGLFLDFKTASKVINDLKKSGISKKDIAVITKEEAVLLTIPVTDKNQDQVAQILRKNHSQEVDLVKSDKKVKKELDRTMNGLVFQHRISK